MSDPETCAMCPYYYRSSYESERGGMVWEHNCQHSSMVGCVGAHIISLPIATNYERTIPRRPSWCRRGAQAEVDE